MVLLVVWGKQRVILEGPQEKASGVNSVRVTGPSLSHCYRHLHIRVRSCRASLALFPKYPEPLIVSERQIILPGELHLQGVSGHRTVWDHISRDPC